MALQQLLLLQRARETDPQVRTKHKVTVDAGRREPGSRQEEGWLPGDSAWASSAPARCGTFPEALPKGVCGLVPPSASLTFLSNTHSSLVPASPASAAGPAGTFFPWTQSKREGEVRGLTQPGGNPYPADPLSLPLLLPRWAPPGQLSLCAPSRWPAVGRAHVPCGGVGSRSQHPQVPTAHFTDEEVEEGATVPV